MLIAITTQNIVRAFTEGTPAQKDHMLVLLFKDRTLRKTLFGLTKHWGGDFDLAEHAFLDALMDFKTQVERRNFQTGNWRGMIRTIFQARYADHDRNYRGRLSTVEMMDFLIRPFEHEGRNQEMQHAYRLAFQLFEKIPWCVEKHCAVICREKIENGLSTEELIEQVETRLQIAWDIGRNDRNNGSKQINQRMRDRISDCWNRLQDYIHRYDAGQYILKALKAGIDP